MNLKRYCSRNMRLAIVLILLLVGCHSYPHSVRHRNDSIQKEYEHVQKLNSKVDSLMQIIREYEEFNDRVPYPRYLRYTTD